MEDFKKGEGFTSGFRKGLLIAMLSPLLIIGIFNYTIDPYQLSRERIPGLNDALSYKNFLGENALENAFQAYSRGDAATISVLGTSHIAKGIPVDNKPQVEKFTMSGLRLYEGVQLAQMIIDRSAVSKTILIEVGESIPTERGKPIKRQMRFLHMETTLKSVRLIRRSIRLRKQENKFTIDRPFLATPKPSVLNDLKIRLVDNLLESAEALDSLLSGSSFGEVKTRHKIVFFTSPMPRDFIDTPEIARKIEASHREIERAVLRFNETSDHIRFGFVGLLGSDLGSEYEPGTEDFYNGWYDYGHYRPVVGEQLFRVLLDLSDNLD